MRTTQGRDWQARVMGDGAAVTAGTGDMAPATWLGVSANADPESDANTSLPGEIAAGSLARAEATYGHTNGQATYTLTKTFTSDQEVTINKIGIHYSEAGASLVFEELLDDPVPMFVGDQMSFTVTVTL